MCEILGISFYISLDKISKIVKFLINRLISNLNFLLNHINFIDQDFDKTLHVKKYLTLLVCFLVLYVCIFIQLIHHLDKNYNYMSKFILIPL